MNALKALPFLVALALAGCGSAPVEDPTPEPSKKEEVPVDTIKEQTRSNCEQNLARCINGGGDLEKCWNSYWRCSGV